MGSLVTVLLAAVVGAVIALGTAVSVGHAVSPDNAVATYLSTHSASQPNVLDYGSR